MISRRYHYLSKDVEVCGCGGLLDELTADPKRGLGHPAVFAASQQQVAEGIANVGVFVLVGRVSEPFLAGAD